MSGICIAILSQWKFNNSPVPHRYGDIRYDRNATPNDDSGERWRVVSTYTDVMRQADCSGCRKPSQCAEVISTSPSCWHRSCSASCEFSNSDPTFIYPPPHEQTSRWTCSSAASVSNQNIPVCMSGGGMDGSSEIRKMRRASSFRRSVRVRSLTRNGRILFRFQLSISV